MLMTQNNYRLPKFHGCRIYNKAKCVSTIAPDLFHFVGIVYILHFSCLVSLFSVNPRYVVFCLDREKQVWLILIVDERNWISLNISYCQIYMWTKFSGQSNDTSRISNQKKRKSWYCVRATNNDRQIISRVSRFDKSDLVMIHSG